VGRSIAVKSTPSKGGSPMKKTITPNDVPTASGSGPSPPARHEKDALPAKVERTGKHPLIATEVLAPRTFWLLSLSLRPVEALSGASAILKDREAHPRVGAEVHPGDPAVPADGPIFRDVVVTREEGVERILAVPHSEMTP
jgi:hypothetical protein